MTDYNNKLDAIIRKFGFEAPQTICFARAIENDTDARDIELLFDILMTDDIDLDDEDED